MGGGELHTSAPATDFADRSVTESPEASIHHCYGARKKSLAVSAIQEFE
jgi:hypothetical protein